MNSDDKDILLKADDLSIGYRNKVLYGNISLEIRKGDCIMLCGANGSGKTTLLKTIAGLSEIFGTESVMIPSRIPKVAGFTLREYARLCCFRQSGSNGLLSRQDEESLSGALEQLGLLHLSSRDISTLSDGEFQKAGLASALVRKVPLLLLDEPTAFLDAVNRISVLQTLRGICDRGKQAIIFSTHDLHDGLKVAGKVFALGSDGYFRSSTSEMEETVRSIFF